MMGAHQATTPANTCVKKVQNLFRVMQKIEVIVELEGILGLRYQGTVTKLRWVSGS